MLKALFGTAVVSDVTQLHELFDELQSTFTLSTTRLPKLKN